MKACTVSGAVMSSLRWLLTEGTKAVSEAAAGCESLLSRLPQFCGRRRSASNRHEFPNFLCEGPRLREEVPSFVLVKHLVVTGIFGIWCSGCLAVPIHHAKNMRSITADAAPPQVDLTFVKFGETSRDEVTKRLSWIDAGVTGKNFFVGRWAENNWDIVWGGASYPYMGGGSYEIWKTHNVIIDFDDQSWVIGVTQFADKNIIATLSSRLRQASEPTLDLTVAIKIPIEYLCLTDINNPSHIGDLMLSSDELKFLESPRGDKKGKYSYKTPAKNMTHITMGYSDPSQPQQICAILHFRLKTQVGKQMSVRVDLAGTAVLIKYLAEYGSGGQAVERKWD